MYSVRIREQFFQDPSLRMQITQKRFWLDLLGLSAEAGQDKIRSNTNPGD